MDTKIRDDNMADVANTTGLEHGLHEQHLRRRSINVIEIQDQQGRRKTIHLEDLSDADRALAEQFGYKPVCNKIRSGGIIESSQAD